MITVSKIAKFLGAEVVGDGTTVVTGMELSDIASKGDITFAVDDKALEAAGKSEASCVITSLHVETFPKTVIRVRDIKEAMTVLYNVMMEILPPRTGEVHPTAVVADSASICDGVGIGAHAVVGERVRVGKNTQIGPNCSIGDNVSIGERTVINPNITIYPNTIIGKNVIIHSGTVIGADGFGYLPKDGKIYKVPQMGRVVIGDDVEIGADTCIDRGTFTDTEIGCGTKIDNLVQIAHNVKIGRNVLIAAQTGIAGSSIVGDNTMMGGNVGVADHVIVGRNARIAAKSGVTGRVDEEKVVMGYPHREIKDFKKLFAIESLLIKNKNKLIKLLRSLPDEKE
ncbi:MAG: UDP-3-O-(3-hydroxymyristoyl)glucosamine N-acyltransferase [Candidatus Omnitrophica bacterium]|nr:UDP-3-O-(3-hydroxymyristoyl)glucosamine N-acyltransferase [Candidatus Omnitrophota bacterium]